MLLLAPILSPFQPAEGMLTETEFFFTVFPSPSSSRYLPLTDTCPNLVLQLLYGMSLCGQQNCVLMFQYWISLLASPARRTRPKGEVFVSFGFSFRKSRTLSSLRLGFSSVYSIGGAWLFGSMVLDSGLTVIRYSSLLCTVSERY